MGALLYNCTTGGGAQSDQLSVAFWPFRLKCALPSKCTERLEHLLILAHVHVLESYKHTLHVSSMCV